MENLTLAIHAIGYTMQALVVFAILTVNMPIEKTSKYLVVNIFHHYKYAALWFGVGASLTAVVIK
jgi:hypothetical protein